MTRHASHARASIRTRGTLPHVEQLGSVYFVTFRAADAVGPRSPRHEPHRHDELVRAHDPPLCAGACVLTRPDIGPIVAGALRHFDGERYLLGPWCVMPNHVHVLVAPLGEIALSSILHSWKSFTARQINQLLHRRGPFWEREYFDHRVRSDRWASWFAEYIEWNPVAAGLCQRPEEWRLGSAHGRNEATRWALE